MPVTAATVAVVDTTMNSSQPQPSSPTERDLELLSAYLDNQLSVAERVSLDRRLQSDPALQAELEDLRATTAALRALEPVRPPRSFTLDPATAPRPRRIFPFAFVMQMGSGLAGLALVLLATVQLLGTGLVPAAPSAPASQPTAAAAMEAAPAPGAEMRIAEATAAPAATEAPASAAQALPAATAAPAASEAQSDASAMFEAPSALPAPELGSAGGPAANSPPPGGAGGPPAIDATVDVLQSSGSSSPGTAQLPPPAAPRQAPASTGVPPGLTLALGAALIGLAVGWNLYSRRRA